MVAQAVMEYTRCIARNGPIPCSRRGLSGGLYRPAPSSGLPCKSGSWNGHAPLDAGANVSGLPSRSFSRVGHTDGLFGGRLPTTKRMPSLRKHSMQDGNGSFVDDGGQKSPGGIVHSLKMQIKKLDGLWGQVLPMTFLFFLMAFVNTIIDSLKDSLVITAVGGGTEVLPYLSVYGVLPCSVLFLVAYSWATSKLSRDKIFNIIIFGFLSFYATFAFVYPHHEALHISSLADSLEAFLPSGFSGLVGMIRNWLFTVFYCVSELWGDIVLSLLFWGLANETTSIEDAPLLYPLFGVGANIAQACAGKSLRLISEVSHSFLTYNQQVQCTVALCVCLGLVISACHTYISKTFEKNPHGSAAARLKQKHEAQNDRGVHERSIDKEAIVPGLNYCDINPPESRKKDTDDRKKSADKAMKLGDAWRFLIKSPQIRCLAIMALAQGITTRILEVSWKHYLHLLHPNPVAYAAFLGDTAMWTGVATGFLMIVSPLLFDLFGWRGVASATPNIMLYGGIPFFTSCIIFTFFSTNILATGLVSLRGLVLAGAALQVFSRGAKFSLFKPAEEMVYIGLDDESRTKGKAAIDVVGAQSGKSIGSIVQQMMLIITGGSVSGIIPILAIFYVAMLQQWKSSVTDLAEHCDPAHVHRESLMGSVMGSFDDNDVLDIDPEQMVLNGSSMTVTHDKK